MKRSLNTSRLRELGEKILERTNILYLKKHSPFGEELSLKSEDEMGERNEIYLKKSQVKDKLDSIKEKGRKIYDILGVGK